MAVFRADRHNVRRALNVNDAAVAMQRCARLDGAICQTQCVVQGMDVAAASINQATDIDVCTQQVHHLGCAQLIHIMTTRAPLPASFVQTFQRFAVRCRTDPAAVLRVTLDVVFGNQVKDQRTRTTRKGNHAFAHIRAKLRLGFCRIGLEPRIDLPTIAPGCAPADGLCLKHHNRMSGLSQMKRGRQTREPATNHHRICLGRACQGRAIGALVRCGAPETVSEGKAFILDHV